MDLFNVRCQYELLSCFSHDIDNLPVKKEQIGAKSFPRDNSDREITFQVP